MTRRSLLEMTLALTAGINTSAALPFNQERKAAGGNWREKKWEIDPRCVLPRGAASEFDGSVVGDPCVVWDEDVGTWRMFYFAGAGKGYVESERQLTLGGMALSKSTEQIASGDWHKVGPIPLSNPEDLPLKVDGHKFWVVMDPLRVNHAAVIDGRYCGLFGTTREPEHIGVAWAEKLAGPWTVLRQPILSPDTRDAAPDGQRCDTPTAYWLKGQRKTLIFYKAYPLRAQAGQPGSPFGSSSVVAYWGPGEAVATKGHQILLPGRRQEFCHGWVGGVQLLHDAERESWYALLNGSPTPPEDLSNREPAPCLGGWATCEGPNPDGKWKVDRKHSPFLYPASLTQDQLRAGLGVNFWRHHLVVTPSGRARIFFNSGKYGTEQMYSLVARSRF
jgi:hypothetical protein